MQEIQRRQQRLEELMVRSRIAAAAPVAAPADEAAQLLAAGVSMTTACAKVSLSEAGMFT